MDENENIENVPKSTFFGRAKQYEKTIIENTRNNP